MSRVFGWALVGAGVVLAASVVGMVIAWLVAPEVRGVLVLLETSLT